MTANLQEMWYFDPPLDNLPEQPPHPNFGIVSILSQRTFTFKEFIRQDNKWKRENTSGNVFILIFCGIVCPIIGVHLLLKKETGVGAPTSTLPSSVLGVIILVFGVFMTFGHSASLMCGEKCDKV